MKISYRRSTTVLSAYFIGKRYVLKLTQNGLGYILGSIFKNSSGHPVHEQETGKNKMK
jgi:hypothetical protein